MSFSIKATALSSPLLESDLSNLVVQRKFTESSGWGSSSTVFTDLFLEFWGFVFFCFLQTLAKWFINRGLLFGFWKLFSKEQFAVRGLLGNWIAFTLAGLSVLFCCWIRCWFRIPSSILITNSSACRGSTVCLISYFWISGSIKLVMNTSLIRVSSLFSKSQFSAISFCLP